MVYPIDLDLFCTHDLPYTKIERKIHSILKKRFAQGRDYKKKEYEAFKKTLEIK